MSEERAWTGQVDSWDPRADLPVWTKFSYIFVHRTDSFGTSSTGRPPLVQSFGFPSERMPRRGDLFVVSYGNLIDVFMISVVDPGEGEVWNHGSPVRYWRGVMVDLYGDRRWFKEAMCDQIGERLQARKNGASREVLEAIDVACGL